MFSATKNKWAIPTTVGIIGTLALVNLSIQTLDYNLLVFSFAAILSILLFITLKSGYISTIDNQQENLKSEERAQSIALLENLTAMVNQLEYRDNVLIQEKEQAEAANKAKNDFISSMSHELRTPMHAILNFADLGRVTCIDNNYDKRLIIYFNRIEESGERLLNIINGLLDLTRLESGKVNFKFEQNDIIACINYACNEISATMQKKSISVNIQNNAPISTYKFSKDHIIMVLINLLSNAIKFSPENSLISIIIDNSQYKSDNKKEYQGIKISIEDQGIGIEENEKNIIFDKFIQGSRKSGKECGSGIGLAICKEIINAHGGYIWAENRSDQGARVSFIITE